MRSSRIDQAASRFCMISSSCFLSSRSARWCLDVCRSNTVWSGHFCILLNSQCPEPTYIASCSLLLYPNSVENQRITRYQSSSFDFPLPVNQNCKLWVWPFIAKDHLFAMIKCVGFCWLVPRYGLVTSFYWLFNSQGGIHGNPYSVGSFKRLFCNGHGLDLHLRFLGTELSKIFLLKAALLFRNPHLWNILKWQWQKVPNEQFRCDTH